MTKKYRRLSALFYILAMLCFLVPMGVFGGMALAAYQTSKVLITCVIGAAILFLIDLLRHGKYRMSTWLLLTGLVFTASLPMVQLAVAVTCAGVFLDDVVFSPLHRKYKRLAEINKEIDKRIIVVQPTETKE